MVSIDMRMHDACMLSGRTRMYNAGMVKEGIYECMTTYMVNRNKEMHDYFCG